MFCSSMVRGPFFSEPESGVFFPQVESHEVGISLEGRHCEGELNTGGVFHNGEFSVPPWGAVGAFSPLFTARPGRVLEVKLIKVCPPNTGPALVVYN